MVGVQLVVFLPHHTDSPCDAFSARPMLSRLPCGPPSYCPRGLACTIAPVLNGGSCRVRRRGRTLDRRLRAHQVRRSRQHQFGRQLSLLVRAAREVGGGYGGDGEEGRGDRTQGGNSTFSQQQSRRMQERVVESKIDGDSLESLSTEKINGQASVGAQYVHTYGIQYTAFHGIMAYLSVVLVSFPDPPPPLRSHFWSGREEERSGNIAIPFLYQRQESGDQSDCRMQL